MRSVESGTPLPDISRFNWKDGFYTQNTVSANTGDSSYSANTAASS